MSEEQLILWKPKLLWKVNDGIDNIVKEGELLHESLTSLRHYAMKSNTIYLFAMVKCNPDEVHKDPLLSPGWYVANRDIQLATDYMR